MAGRVLCLAHSQVRRSRIATTWSWDMVRTPSSDLCAPGTACMSARITPAPTEWPGRPSTTWWMTPHAAQSDRQRHRNGRLPPCSAPGMVAGTRNRPGALPDPMQNAMQEGPTLYSRPQDYAAHLRATGREEQARELEERSSPLLPVQCRCHGMPRQRSIPRDSENDRERSPDPYPQDRSAASCCAPARGSGSTGRESRAQPVERAPGRGTHMIAQAGIPAGTFLMGDSHDDGKPTDGETPVHEVRLDAFSIDTTCVTNADFQRFVDDTDYLTEAELFGSSAVFHLAFDGMDRDMLGRHPSMHWWLEVRGASWRHPGAAQQSRRTRGPPCRAGQLE